MDNELSGRGPVAVADMKARIAALRATGADVIDVLWQRHQKAYLGDGYAYEFARAEQVRPDGERGQPDRR